MGQGGLTLLSPPRTVVLLTVVLRMAEPLTVVLRMAEPLMVVPLMVVPLMVVLRMAAHWLEPRLVPLRLGALYSPSHCHPLGIVPGVSSSSLGNFVILSQLRSSHIHLILMSFRM